MTFTSFSKLMEAAWRTNESVRKSSRSTSDRYSEVAPRPFPKKRPVIAAVEDGQEIRPPSPNKPSFRQGYKVDNKQGKKSYAVLLPFPCGTKKALALLNYWVKDEATTLPRVNQLPCEEDQQEPNFCHITGEDVTIWSSASCSKKSLTRN